MRPRVGHIQFLNCLPLYHGLVHSRALLDIDLTKGTPTELNRLLLTGELDVSPISSIEYLRHADELVLLPFAVAADGPVRSISLVATAPIEQLDGGTVAVANTSATSVALLELLVRDHWGIKLDSFTCPPDLPRMLAEADAALLIGDDALRAAGTVADVVTYDLAEEWQRLTGQPMVFAVWVARREWAESHPDELAAVQAAFHASLEHSLAHVDEIAAATARWEPFDGPFLAAYFRGLTFTFGAAERAGLREFAERLLAGPESPGFDAVPDLGGTT